MATTKQAIIEACKMSTVTPEVNPIKNFGCNLQIFLISYSVCPWQALPASSNLCGLGQGRPTLEWST